MASEDSIKCNCEHDDHIAVTLAHRYGGAKGTVIIKTPYGIFNLCSDCKTLEHMTGKAIT